MTPKASTHITCTARLHMPPDFDSNSNQGDLRIKQRLNALCRDHADHSWDGDVTGVTLRQSVDGNVPVYDLNVTATCHDAALRELARLSLALVVRHPVTHIGWQPEDALIDRKAFLSALASPAPVRPAQRPCPDARTARSVSRRPSVVSDDRRLEIRIRADLCRPVETFETAQMRTQVGMVAPERRIARATLAISSAMLAMNASGAMASVLTMAGML